MSTTNRDTTPHGRGDYDDANHDCNAIPMRIGISGPGDLIAAIPGLIGFIPDDSLVAILLGGSSGRELRAAMRMDLPPVLMEPQQLDAVASKLEELYCDEPFEVMLVIVDGSWNPAGGPEACHRAMVRQLLESLRGGPVLVGGILLTEAIAAGASWIELPGDEADRCGVVPDPYASALTAAHVLEGRVVHGSRQEMAAALATDPEPVRTVLDYEIRSQERAVLEERRAHGEVAEQQELQDVLAAAAQVADGDEPDLGLLARAAIALGSPVIRDVAMQLSAGCGEPVDAAERLWLLLTRRLHGRLRADAAVLYAFSTYFRGEGPIAGEAVDVALAEHPGHRMATLLGEALERGIRPDRLRWMIMGADQ